MIRLLLFLFLLMTFIFPFTVEGELFIPFGIITFILFLVDIARKRWLDILTICIVWGCFIFIGYVSMLVMAWGEKGPFDSSVVFGLVFTMIVLFLVTIFNKKINTFFKKSYKK